MPGAEGRAGSSEVGVRVRIRAERRARSYRAVGRRARWRRSSRSGPSCSAPAAACARSCWGRQCWAGAASCSSPGCGPSGPGGWARGRPGPAGGHRQVRASRGTLTPHALPRLKPPYRVLVQWVDEQRIPKDGAAVLGHLGLLLCPVGPMSEVRGPQARSEILRVSARSQGQRSQEPSNGPHGRLPLGCQGSPEASVRGCWAR